MTEEMRQKRIGQNLLKQEGTGWDVGFGILFLCSKEAKWITGLIMPIDGGVSDTKPNAVATLTDVLCRRRLEMRIDRHLRRTLSLKRTRAY